MALATAPGTMAPLRHVQTPVLSIGCFDAGAGPAVVLLHGFPYDIHAYADVAPMLVAAGCRVIVPYLRGAGATCFRAGLFARTAEQGALASDVVDLLDALGVRRALLAGFDWGARAACATAALWPSRCAGLVSAGGYALHDLRRAATPAPPEQEAACWHQYYFLSERGRAGLTARRRELAQLLWRQWSPQWRFSRAEFDRTAAAFDNPDWVEVVLHSYRYKLGAAPGDPRYAHLARRLLSQPRIEIPAITVEGAAHGVVRPTDGRQWSALFTRHVAHRVVAGAGHNVPQEQPRAFAEAVLALATAIA
jgi:pimeloyl-ACP methyl ester carboxylesterase